MNRKKDAQPEGGRSPTDDLIDQALNDFESSSKPGAGDSPEQQGSDGEIRPFDRNSDYDTTDGRKVGRIDVKQYVEKEAFMRLAADFDNFRKRVLKERTEWERLGKEKVIRGFLDILDNLRRGLGQPDADNSSLAEGMRMVVSQAETWLQAEGLERIPTIGKMFDPAFHEAVAKIEDFSKPDGMIVEEVRSGYRWDDRLVRPATVVVVKSNDSGVVPSKSGE